MNNLFYKLIFRFSQKFLQLPGTKLWYRNSLYFNKTRFLRSDIDLSLYIGPSAEGAATDLFMKRYKLLKKLIPIIGEVNIYNNRILNDLQNHNRYELARDPLLIELMKKMGLLIPNGDEFSKRIFITRMLLANSRSVESNHFDTNKWAFYFAHIGLNAPANFNEIFYYCLSKNGSFAEITESLALNPIPKMSNAINGSLFDMFLFFCQNLAKEDKELLRSNLLWEKSALKSQIIEMKDHITKLDEIIRSL